MKPLDVGVPSVRRARRERIRQLKHEMLMRSWGLPPNATVDQQLSHIMSGYTRGQSFIRYMPGVRKIV